DRQQRQHDRLDQRNRREGPPRLLAEQTEREEAEALAAEVLGDGETDQVRFGELLPELAVEAGARRVALDLTQAIEARARLQDLRGEVLRDLFFFAELEVHDLLLVGDGPLARPHEGFERAGPGSAGRPWVTHRPRGPAA